MVIVHCGYYNTLLAFSRLNDLILWCNSLVHKWQSTDFHLACPFLPQQKGKKLKKNKDSHKVNVLLDPPNKKYPDSNKTPIKHISINSLEGFFPPNIMSPEEVSGTRGHPPGFEGEQLPLPLTKQNKCQIQSLYSFIKSKFKDFSRSIFNFLKDWKLLLLWKWGSKGGDLRQNYQITFQYVLCVFHCHIKKYEKCISGVMHCLKLQGPFKDFSRQAVKFKGHLGCTNPEIYHTLN